LNPEYVNVKKFIILSGIHIAPRTFRDGVKTLPPTKLWGPFKGQVRKIAPKILFSRNCQKEISDPFVNHAFTIPDKVYSDIFRDFLPKYDYTDLIPQVSKPILFLWGKEDQLIPENIRNEVIEKFSNQDIFYKVFSGGHMFLYEEPNDVGQEIARFILSTRSRIEIE
jgi:pimeloyl-ACP methyl ester carboxylesterase